MSQINRLIRRFLPSSWRQHITELRALRIVEPLRLAGVIGLGLLSILCEAFGVTMILPIIAFVQEGALTGQSGVSALIADVFAWAGLTVTLGSLCSIVFALICARQVATYAYTLAQARLKHRIGRTLAMRAFEMLMRANGPHLARTGQAVFVNLINHQAQATAVLVRCYLAVIQILLTAAVYLGVIVASAPLISVGAIAVVGLIMAGIARFGRGGKQVSAALIDRRSSLVGFLTSRFAAWRIIKAFDTLDREVATADALTRDFADKSVSLVRSVARVQLVTGPLIAALALLFVYGSITWAGATPGTIALFLIVLVRLIPIAQSLAAQRQTITISEASLHFVARQLTEARAARETSPGAAPFIAPRRDIEFRNVSFAYPTTEGPALRDVSLVIPAGRTTAIVGESGAGKSTLTDLLTRLIRPDSGAILIDGEAVESFDLWSLRRGIAHVGQDTVLFDASVRDNVAYGRPEATDAQVREACRSANAEDFIAALPRGYDTILGPEGQDLSGGQRQRLALARALLIDAPVIVLDEPTSALDARSERQIREALENLKGRTIIIVTHRMDLADDADQVIELRDGRIHTSRSQTAMSDTELT